MPKLVETNNFKRIKNKLDQGEILKLEKQIRKILANSEVGKPMRNVRKGTREVYIGSFRLSYSFDKVKDTIFLLDFYHKDEQ